MAGFSAVIAAMIVIIVSCLMVTAATYMFRTQGLLAPDKEEDALGKILGTRTRTIG